MSLEENTNTQPSAIAQMKQVLVEQQEIIDNKLQELEVRKNSLAEFESKVVQKVNELKSEQDAFAQEKAEFKAYVTAENKKIDAAWVEIREYEDKLKASTDEVLAEKIQFEELQKERLEKELKADIPGNLTSSVNLTELGAMIGIDVDTPADVEEMEKTPENVLVEGIPAGLEPEIPELFNDFKSVAERMFSGPKNYVIEITEEHLCMQIGDKEVRLFNNEPLPEVHIVVNRKNARSDAKLQKKLPLIARTIPDWTFETEANHLICKMYFTNQTNIELVLTKCKECIEKIDEL